MSGRIRLEREAVEDLEVAVEHYAEKAGEDVALRFVETTEHAFSLLAEHPEMGRRYEVALHPRLRDVRVWPLRDFPYLVFYQVLDETVLVLALVEAHQDLPEFFRKRWNP